MGGVASKETITTRLDELDKKELEVNKKLKELQMQLNDIVPDEEKIKVNEHLGVENDQNSPDGIQEMNPMENKEEEENEFDDEQEEEEEKPKKKKKKEESNDEDEEEEESEEEETKKQKKKKVKRKRQRSKRRRKERNKKVR